MSRAVDRDYAELSFRVGFFCAAADQHLGGAEFVTRARQNRWALTHAMFAEWKHEAIERGVPADSLEISQHLLPSMVSAGITLQQGYDTKTGHT